MRHLKTKGLVVIAVLQAVAAFGSGLTDDLKEAGSRYRRDSQTNEPVARQQLIQELNRIKEKAGARHESRIVSFCDGQIKDLERGGNAKKEQMEEPLWSDLLWRAIPAAIPVPGKPGFVFSPFGNYKGYIDVRGIPPGTEVKEPYSGKSFMVP